MLLEILWQWLIWLQAGFTLSEKKFPWNMVQWLSVVPSDVLAFPWMCTASAPLFRSCKAVVSPQCMLSFFHTPGCSWSSIHLWKICYWFHCAMNPSCLCDSTQSNMCLFCTCQIMFCYNLVPYMWISWKIGNKNCKKYHFKKARSPAFIWFYPFKLRNV